MRMSEEGDCPSEFLSTVAYTETFMKMNLSNETIQVVCIPNQHHLNEELWKKAAFSQHLPSLHCYPSIQGRQETQAPSSTLDLQGTKHFTEKIRKNTREKIKIKKISCQLWTNKLRYIIRKTFIEENQETATKEFI